MSGIAGILHLDGAPVDSRLLRRGIDLMTFRGPDAQNIWVNGPIGLGHTLLRTTEESHRENQPFSLDNRTWIVADARLDARNELGAKLEIEGMGPSRCDMTDAELILRAYQAWDGACVDHLLGDFAFAIWDTQANLLFCARDHLGVKPFFYAHIRNAVIFSNTLDVVRQHPLVSNTLNDLAIADFLLFNLNQDLATTSFLDIQRLPPGHRGVFSRTGVRVECYWRLPVDEPVYYRRASDFEDRFRELLETAVRDRLRGTSVGIFMSGGLDSGALAATACRILRQKSAAADVRAFTTVWDELDRNERYYAGLTAAFLGIPIRYRDLSKTVPDLNSLCDADMPEPVWSPMSPNSQYYRAVSFESPVCFLGEGPDNALSYEWRAYLAFLLRQRRFGRLFRDVGSLVLRHRRIPLLPTIPRMLRERLFGRDWTVRYPCWLSKTLEARLNLRERWRLDREKVPRPPTHRPWANVSLVGPQFETLFRAFDAEGTNAALEVRHPYMDLRVLRFMLSVPTIPWCRSKYLLRHSMRRELPNQVLRRRKSPLSSDPAWESVRTANLPRLVPVTGLENYVAVRDVPTALSDMVRFRTDSRPYKLNYWLQQLQSTERM